MFPKLNFNIVLDKYIKTYVTKDNQININNLKKHGFIDSDNDCVQFVLSILYKLEPVYNSINVSRDVKSSILTLWNQLIKESDYHKRNNKSFNSSFNKSFN